MTQPAPLWMEGCSAYKWWQTDVKESENITEKAEKFTKGRIDRKNYFSSGNKDSCKDYNKFY